MRHESQQTKISTLSYYVEIWKQRAGSREAVAIAIAEKHYELGLSVVTGIELNRQGDAFKVAKTLADRIFRWLDDRTKDNVLLPMNFEQSILVAMPADLALRYANDTLCPVGFVVRPKTICVGGDEDPVKMAHAQHKEGTEVTNAMLNLYHCDDLEAMERALKESLELIAQTKAAVSYLTSRIHLKKYGVSL